MVQTCNGDIAMNKMGGKGRSVNGVGPGAWLHGEIECVLGHGKLITKRMINLFMNELQLVSFNNCSSPEMILLGWL